MKLIILICLSLFSINIFSRTVDFAKDQKRKVVVFVSATCPCSQKALKHLEELSKKYSQYDFYAINETTSLSKEESRQFFIKEGIDFKLLDDPGLKIADAFSAIKTPHAFILDENNNVLFEGGMANTTEVANAQELYLAQALSENSVNKTITKPLARALGCYIKRD